MSREFRTEALILDFDGVVVDSMPVKSGAASRVLGEAGVQITAEQFARRHAGRRIHESFSFLLQANGISLDRVDSLVSRREELVAEDLRRGRIGLIDGALRLLRRARDARVPTVVATGSRREYAEAVIAVLDLDVYLADVVSSYDGDVSRGKPHPDVVLVAASRVSAAPERCIAVEDALQGLIAASRAGMICYLFGADAEMRSAADVEIGPGSYEAVAALDDISI